GSTPGSCLRPSGIARDSELFGPLSQRVRLPFEDAWFHSLAHMTVSGNHVSARARDLQGRASSLDIIAMWGGQSSTAAVLWAALDTKRQAEQGGSRSERPKRENGFPAQAPHSGADGRLTSAPTTRGRTARTPPA